GRAATDASGILGGAWLRDDLRVDPRTTVGTLASWLSQQGNVSLHWKTTALGFGTGAARRAEIHTSRGTIQADQVFVCVGHDVDYLFPTAAEKYRVNRCSLNMAAAVAPAGLKLRPAVLTGTSMLRYPAFADMPSAAELEAELRASDQQLFDMDANIMFTQRPDGMLLLGDSHAYSATPQPFQA